MRRAAVLLAILAGTAHAQEDETLKGLDRCFAISKTANEICESSTDDTDSRMACLKKVLKEQQDCLDRVQVGGRLPSPTAAPAKPEGTAPASPRRRDAGKTRPPGRPVGLPGAAPEPPVLDRPAETVVAPAPDPLAREKALQEKAAREKALEEEVARERAVQEQAVRDRAASEKEAAEQAAREAGAKEQAAREADEKASREQAAAREQAAREEEQAARQAREQVVRDAAAREQAKGEQAKEEQAAGDRAVRQAKGDEGYAERPRTPGLAGVASAWTVSETRSPVDYSPIVSAEIASSSPPVARAPAELVLRCRGMRTEITVRTHDAWRPARTGDVEVAFAPEEGQIQRFRWPVAQAGRSAGPTADGAEILRALPAARTSVTVTDGTGSAAISAFDLTGLEPVRARIAAACARSAGAAARRR